MVDFVCEVSKPFPLQVSLQNHQNGRCGADLGGQHLLPEPGQPRHRGQDKQTEEQPGRRQEYDDEDLKIDPVYLFSHTLVLKQKKVPFSVAACNIEVPHHFGILKVYRFQKISAKKNLTSPFWENGKILFSYLAIQQNSYIWYKEDLDLEPCHSNVSWCKVIQMKVLDSLLMSNNHLELFCNLLLARIG